MKISVCAWVSSFTLIISDFPRRNLLPYKGIYDGGNVIAEYDNGDLANKYIHGARVDELVCMIHVADSNAVYYYHYDGLGSVVALSNSSGNSCYSYEYSAYGQVATSDPNFAANPYLFTGRRFDYETGLYYYRARYYNPYIGRFLQTDPIGYDDGINWYAYCGNNPLGLMDPSGTDSTRSCDHNTPCGDWKSMYYSHLFKAEGENQMFITEDIMVIPGIFGDPYNKAAMQVLADACDTTLARLAFSALSPPSPPGIPSIGDAYLDRVKRYKDELQTIADKFSQSGQFGWKAFILVQEYEYKKVGIINRRYEWVKKGDPIWVEVRGFQGWNDPLGSWGDRSEYDGYTGRHYGYSTFQNAFDAAENGSRFYLNRNYAPSQYTSLYWQQREREGYCPTHGHICPALKF